MTHPTTFVITMCVIGIASFDLGEELAWNTQSVGVQPYAAKERPDPQNSEYDKKPLTVHKHEPILERFDQPVSKSGLVTQLQSDERFWRIYRDFDADADTMLAWKDFQIGFAGRNQ